jgi:hypothetical protein
MLVRGNSLRPFWAAEPRQRFDVRLGAPRVRAMQNQRPSQTDRTQAQWLGMDERRCPKVNRRLSVTRFLIVAKTALTTLSDSQIRPRNVC